MKRAKNNPYQMGIIKGMMPFIVRGGGGEQTSPPKLEKS